MSFVVDIGANLTDGQFKYDLDEVLEKADKENIKIIITGTSVKESKQAINLVEEYPEYSLKCTAGIHPHKAKYFNKKSG